MDLFDLSGRAALVTGGSSGIGFGIASGLAKAGASVVIAARDEARAADAVRKIQDAGGKASALSADVTDPEAAGRMVAETVARHGRLDILVNNAGGIIRKRPETITDDEWDRTLDWCLTSAFRCCRAAYPEFKKAGGGKILNNGSLAALFGAPFTAAYGAAKGGIVQLTRSLAVAWAKDNIQVNCFLPGWIATGQTANLRKDVPGMVEHILERCPMGRFGTGEDFEGIAVFLAGPASNFITGAAIPIDGGFSVAQ